MRRGSAIDGIRLFPGIAGFGPERYVPYKTGGRGHACGRSVVDRVSSVGDHAAGQGAAAWTTPLHSWDYVAPGSRRVPAAGWPRFASPGLGC